MQADLALRDIHVPPAPPWWPPAPGWWIVAAFATAVIAIVAWRAWRRWRQRARIARLFDEAVASAVDPAQRVARMAELLRRAALQRDPGTARLHGEAWLAALDDAPDGQPFTDDDRVVLLEGAYRRDTTAAQAAALQGPARERFLRWMARP